MSQERKLCTSQKVSMEILRESLKTILRNYSVMNPKVKAQLIQLGFEVSRNRKHSILIFHVNGKTLTFPLSNTPSDKRAGLNMASIICNRIAMCM